LRSGVQLAQTNVSITNAVVDSSSPIFSCLQFTIIMILDDTPIQQKLQSRGGEPAASWSNAARANI